ncbi:MAG: SPOR domain-containing protein [Deltaproteobacteria bacterium]|nr:SPOR domain-containing protein [Deltaproteobacteria bacterium]
MVPEELRLAEDATTPLPEAWLVIVESVPKSARDKAEASLARQRRKGLDLVLVDTDAYPRLKSGMWALSMGPFDTKAEAEAAAANLKPKVRDLMVRRGL